MLFDSASYLQLFMCKCFSHLLWKETFNKDINNCWELDWMALKVFSNLNGSISLFLVN